MRVDRTYSRIHAYARIYSAYGVDGISGRNVFACSFGETVIMDLGVRRFVVWKDCTYCLQAGYSHDFFMYTCREVRVQNMFFGSSFLKDTHLIG